MKSTGEDTSVPTLTLATRASFFENTTSLQSMHDSDYSDGTINRVTLKPSKTSNVTVSLNRDESTKQITAASTELGAKIAGDGKHTYGRG